MRYLIRSIIGVTAVAGGGLIWYRVKNNKGNNSTTKNVKNTKVESPNYTTKPKEDPRPSPRPPINTAQNRNNTPSNTHNNKTQTTTPSEGIFEGTRLKRDIRDILERN